MGYEVKTLSVVCDVRDGTHDSPKYVSDGYPLVSSKNIKDGKLDFENINYISEQDYISINKRSKVNIGDIIMPMIGTIGNPLLLIDEPNYAIKNVALFKPIKDVLLSEFLYLLLVSPVVKRQLESHSRGGTQKFVSLKILRGLKIPLPPLDIQKKIVEILDSAQNLIDKRKEQIKEMDNLVQSLFYDMFGDPVTNPKGWEVKKLGDICNVGSGKRVFSHELVDNGIPFYRGTEIGQMAEGKIIEPTLFITENHYEELSSHTGIPVNGDLLLPSICPDGRIYIVNNEEPFYFKDGRVLWIKSGSSDINPIFLRYYLKAVFFSNYNRIATGTTFAELKIVSLKKLLISLPPVQKQKDFGKKIDEISSLKTSISESLTEMEDNFNSLMQRAFKGELV